MTKKSGLRYSVPAHEEACRCLADFFSGRAAGGGGVAEVRRESRGTVRAARAHLRGEGISKQDQPSAQQRRERGAAAKTDAGVLRLLRLAFVGPRTLVARAIGENFSRRTIREAGA